jgi:hypothetical protein
MLNKLLTKSFIRFYDLINKGQISLIMSEMKESKLINNNFLKKTEELSKKEKAMIRDCMIFY